MLLSFKSLQDFFDFVEKENEFWILFQGSTFNGMYNQLSRALNVIKRCTNMAPNEDVEQQLSYIDEASDYIRNIRPFYVLSTSKLGCFLKDKGTNDMALVNAAYDYFISEENENVGLNTKNRAYIKGFLQCFVWNDLDPTLREKIKSNRTSMENLTNEFAERIDKLKTQYDEIINSINTKNTKAEEMANLMFSSQENSFNILTEDCKNKLDTMETSFRELIKLKGPAQYWNTLHKNYTGKGNSWKWLAIIFSVVWAAFLALVLYRVPEDLISNLTTFNLQSAKATIILALIVSIGVYLIRLFVKLATSAYHLATDAMERYNLTMVYLAMVQDNNISEEERSIVLQSLFARSDTGLLKGDSGPTLPVDGAISTIFKNIGK